MLVKIKRRKSALDKAYWQTFDFECGKDLTVAALLDELNYTDDLYDTEGQPATRILWECSCMQKICGACAMVINGVPALACNTFLRDIKGDTLVLEPLSKFPVVADLIVDRSIIEENLKKSRIYTGEYSGISAKEYDHCYAAAKCIKCGLCLEVCPNYSKGENFFGALFANDAFLTKSMSKERAGEIKKQYNAHFAAGCSKCLSCQHICPMEIPTLASMLRMNK
ncbi:MAG: 2Fe-2S iron-sulfur cluster-binding protein [Candidatus Coproplasma sp.]